MRPGRIDIYRVPVMLNEGCRSDRSEESRVYLPHNIESMTPWVNQTQSGNVTGTNLLAPYGQVMPPSSTNDPYVYANLFQDTEYGGDSAWYRNYSTEQTRWLRPDPYNGSYDINNPQSFNRYMYTNGNPLEFTDPSGLADGLLTGAGGSLCSSFGGDVFSGYNGISIGGFKPCDPTAFILSYALTPVVNGITSAINGIFDTTLSTSISASEIAPVIGAAFAIGCSIESSQALCGPPGWTSVIPGNWGKVTADSIATAGAVAGVMCATGNAVACGALFGYAIYTAVTDVLAGLGLFEPPQFTGSLLPRPTDLGGLGTSPIGIPNQNLTIKSILGQPSRGAVQSPGMNIP